MVKETTWRFTRSKADAGSYLVIDPGASRWLIALDQCQGLFKRMNDLQAANNDAPKGIL